MSVHYFAGIGCRRGVAVTSLHTLITQTLRDHRIPLDQLAAIASIDSKRDEVALRELAEMLDVSLLFFSTEQLQCYAGRVSAISDVVRDAVGSNVAEAAALAAAEMLSGQRAELIIPKSKNADATFALAVTPPATTDISDMDQTT